jgi:pyruvate dehydrogenase E1 component
VVTIVREGMRRMYEAQEDVYYYITLMNENYPHPGLSEAGQGAQEGILKGLYLLKDSGKAAQKKLRVQLVGSGSILREVIAASDLLKSDFGIVADIWSATSFNELRRDGMAAERWNLLHPTEPRRASWVQTQLAGHEGPVIASTDYIRNYADQIREYVHAAGRRYVVLGTDGFGRSDYRRNLRRFFEVDRYYIVVAALKALADDGAIKPAIVAEAIVKYNLDAGRAAPWTV